MKVAPKSRFNSRQIIRLRVTAIALVACVLALVGAFENPGLTRTLTLLASMLAVLALTLAALRGLGTSPPVAADLASPVPAPTDGMQQTLDLLSEGVLRFDQDWRCQHINAAAITILGDAAANLLGRCFWNVFAAAKETMFEQNLRAAQQDQIERRFEMLWAFTAIWLDIRVIPAATGTLVVLRNQTREHQALDLLASRSDLALANTAMRQDLRDHLDAEREQTGLLRESDTALGAIDLGCIVLDQDERIRYVNTLLVQAAERTPAELLGKRLWDVFPEFVGSEIERQVRAVQLGGPTVKMHYYWATSARWLEIKLFPLKTRIVASVRDVTQERKISAELLARDQIFRLAQELICVVAGDRFTQVNPATINLLRLSHDQLTAGPWIDLVHSDDRAQAIGLAEQITRKGRHRIAVLRFARGRGEPVWVELSAFSDYNATSYLIGREVGVRIESEHAMQQSFQHMQTRTEELSHFAFVAAHDLQEPLRKLRTFGNMLADRSADTLDATGNQYLSRMLNAGERMSRLIDALLSYSRAEAAIIRPAPLNLNQLVTEIIEDLDARIVESSAQIEVGDLPDIQGDRSQISQVFQNLLINALKFVAKGTAPRIAIAAECFERGAHDNVQPWCRITVRDQGIGFDAEYAEKLFAPFVRLHSRDDYPGSGIGLSIVHRVIQRHGGSIRANSTPGVGTCFTIELPIRQTPA